MIINNNIGFFKFGNWNEYNLNNFNEDLLEGKFGVSSCGNFSFNSVYLSCCS